MSSYSSIDEAFTDIVLDVILNLASRADVVLFVDAVDTEIDGQHMFRRLIAPINGDHFFFHQKQVSFSKQNPLGFYARSGRRETLECKQKWPDFLSRVPSEHRFELPTLNLLRERLYRAASIPLKGTDGAVSITDQAQLFICLRSWELCRQLDQALELGKLRARPQRSAAT